MPAGNGIRAAGYRLPDLMLRVQRPGRRSTGSHLDAIRAVIAEIPRGRVATYGQVAEAAGFPRGARLAARALRGSDGLPWQRVVAAGGRIALSGVEGQDQRIRLRAEGVTFRGDRVRLDLHAWRSELPEDRQRASSAARIRLSAPGPGASAEARGAMRGTFERELARLPGLEGRNTLAPERGRVYARGGLEVVRVGPGPTIAVRLLDDRDGVASPDRRAALTRGGRRPRARWKSVGLATTDDVIEGLALVEAALLGQPGGSDQGVARLEPGRAGRRARKALRAVRVNRR